MISPSRFRKRVPSQCDRGRPFLFILLSAPVILSFVLVPVPLRAAEDFQIGAEYNYITSNIETTNNETGEVSGTDFSAFDQNYNIGLSRQLYPFLTLVASSSFEVNTSTSSTDDITTERQTGNIRPYLNLDLRNPLYSAGIAYSKNQFRNEITDLGVTNDFQESLDLSFTYRPAGLPFLRIFHNRAHSYNDPKTSDTVTSQTTARVSYAIKTHPVSYTYGRGETTDLLTDLKLVTESHEGSATYFRGFLNDRISMDAGYRVRFNITTVPVTGGSIESPLSRTKTFYSADDSPEDGPKLQELDALRDGRTEPLGINIGWDYAGNDPWNIGIDFGFPTGVDRLRVYVNKNVLIDAVNSLSWAVYISPDNEDTSEWKLHARITAPFTVFQNRFEISFPEVSTRYIKVVVAPLSLAFITYDALRSIDITEIEALTTVTVTEDQRTTDVNQNISLGLAGRISDKTRMGYTLSFSTVETDSEPSVGRYSLANSVYMTHIISRMLTATAQVTRDENRTTSDNDITSKTTSHVYSANLRAIYLDTLSQTLTGGYTERDSEKGKQTDSSIYLRTNAALYKGWDVFYDVGYSWSVLPDLGKTTSRLVTVQTSVVPNNKISFDATYTKTSGTTEDKGTTSTQSYDVRASYFPYPFLFFSLQVAVEEESAEDTKQILQRYSTNWSPFRDGDLQVSLFYTETRRSTDGQKERNMGPTLKWDINTYASLTAGYFYTTVETALQAIDLSTATAKLNVTF